MPADADQPAAFSYWTCPSSSRLRTFSCRIFSMSDPSSDTPSDLAANAAGDAADKVSAVNAWQSTIQLSVTSEEQFQVQVGDEIRTGELYYLGIDPQQDDHDCSAQEGLCRLIDAWLAAIESTQPRRIFYLPFDFSDEYTRWLGCEKTESTITVVCGSAEVEGWSFSPTNFGDQLYSLPDFQADEPVNPQTFYTPRFLSGLRCSRAQLAGQSPAAT